MALPDAPPSTSADRDPDTGGPHPTVDPDPAVQQAPSVDADPGRLGRILAVPLIPFVAGWEMLKAAGRGVVAGSRWVGAGLVRVRRLVWRLVSAGGAGPRMALPNRVPRPGPARCPRWGRSGRGRPGCRRGRNPVRTRVRHPTPAGHVADRSRAGSSPGRGRAGVPTGGGGRRPAGLVAARALARAVVLPLRLFGRTVVALIRRGLVAAAGVGAAWRWPSARRPGRRWPCFVGPGSLSAAPHRRWRCRSVSSDRRWLRSSGGPVLPLRAAARAVAVPLRVLARAVAALVRRAALAVRQAAPAAAALLRHVGAGIRAVAREQ